MDKIYEGKYYSLSIHLKKEEKLASLESRATQPTNGKNMSVEKQWAAFFLAEKVSVGRGAALLLGEERARGEQPPFLHIHNNDEMGL